jgi:hypothetical protein
LKINKLNDVLARSKKFKDEIPIEITHMPSPHAKTSVFDKSYHAVRSKTDLSASGNEEENPNLLTIGRKKTGKIPSKEYMNKKRTSIKEYMKNPRLLSSTFQAPCGTTPNNIASSSRLNRSRKLS